MKAIAALCGIVVLGVAGCGGADPVPGMCSTMLDRLCKTDPGRGSWCHGSRPGRGHKMKACITVVSPCYREAEDLGGIKSPGVKPVFAACLQRGMAAAGLN